MARLVLHLDGQMLAEYNMSRERYTIGRLADNDIRIDHPAISGHHAMVLNILNDSFLEDLNSTNGTYVNGRIVKKHALQHGDVVSVGHHTLRFVDSATDEARDEFERTMVIHREGTGLSLEDPSTPAPARHAETDAGARGHANGAPLRGKLQVLSGQFAGRELDLVKTLTTLGRPGAQIAAITRRADGFYIVHVESSQEGDYPRVNGTPIGAQAHRLRNNDVVQLAGVKMGFFEG